MSFTVDDYHDLVQLLIEHPEWKSELRGLLLSQDLLSLPEIVRKLADSQDRTEERIDRLVEAQRKTEERIAELAEAQRRTEQRIDELAEAQKITEQRLNELAVKMGILTERFDKVIDDIGDMKGSMLEIEYRDKAYGYLGHILRRIKVLRLTSIEDSLESALTKSEFKDVFRLDLILRGKSRDITDSPDILLAMEISNVIDINDVDRAWRRAGLIRKAGYRVIPTVAGKEITKGALVASEEQYVAVVQDGNIKNWEQALVFWLETGK
ncbi:hypothetical protein GF312_12695 [Candidatus Poribacteria bacterium]|nr:hypothetical protein [Candidatus Poribacteria bacterium]